MSHIPLSEIHFLILCGGRGSRSENPNKAKILQDISEETSILDLHFQNFTGLNPYGITFLVGYLKDAIQASCEEKLSKKYFNLSVDFLEDSIAGIGTTLAVANAVNNSKAQYFGVIFGDTGISFDLINLVNRWDQEKYDLALIAHANLHPEDSDLIFFDAENQVTGFHFKDQEWVSPSERFLSNSGMLLFRRNLAKQFSKEKDIVKALIACTPFEKITVINSTYYQKDSGTKDRMIRIRNDFRNKAIERRRGPDRAAIFVDRDGTLMPDIPEGRSIVIHKEIDKCALPLIGQANDLGIPIFLVTNQPAVAKGFISINDVERVHSQIQMILLKDGAFFDDYRFCPHHPEVGFLGENKEFKIQCQCRKPNIGMFQSLAIQHSISLSKSVLIGDSDVDKNAAYNSGMRYLHAMHGSSSLLSNALKDSIELIKNAN